MSHSPTKLHHVVTVPLDRHDRKLLEQLSKQEKLPKTEVIRRLIRRQCKELSMRKSA